MSTWDMRGETNFSRVSRNCWRREGRLRGSQSRALKQSSCRIAELMRLVHEDEAHRCAKLDGHVGWLGGSPSRSTGDFHARAMAIADPVERLCFLNRGQRMVRKMEALMSRISDDRFHADLGEMAQRHRENGAGADDCWAWLQHQK